DASSQLRHSQWEVLHGSVKFATKLNPSTSAPLVLFLKTPCTKPKSTEEKSGTPCVKSESANDAETTSVKLDSSNDAGTPSLKPESTKERSTASPRFQVEKKLEVDDPSEMLQILQLQAIASSSEVREALKDEHLQKLISDIDSSPDAMNELDKAMGVDVFRIFSDKILSAINP
ncbi:HIT-type Zinc finger family protein, putative isoform 4, partial [Theobroma cacao]